MLTGKHALHRHPFIPVYVVALIQGAKLHFKYECHLLMVVMLCNLCPHVKKHVCQLSNPIISDHNPYFAILFSWGLQNYFYEKTILPQNYYNSELLLIELVHFMLYFMKTVFQGTYF